MKTYINVWFFSCTTVRASVIQRESTPSDRSETRTPSRCYTRALLFFTGSLRKQLYITNFLTFTNVHEQNWFLVHMLFLLLLLYLSNWVLTLMYLWGKVITKGSTNKWMCLSLNSRNVILLYQHSLPWVFHSQRIHFCNISHTDIFYYQ